MSTALSIATVGDFAPDFEPHLATDAGLRHSGDRLGVGVEARWVPTASIENGGGRALAGAHGFWIAPGSPYRSLDGALAAIRVARERRIPLIGTCAGFQHVVIEYARNVLGFEDAQHAEYDPYASNLFVTPLSCSLAGQTMEIEIKPGSRTEAFYGTPTALERYYCNFGLNSAHQDLLDKGGLNVVGVDSDGEARILEIPGHPFFVATLFVPQSRSTPAAPHPLITAFLAACRSE